MCLNRPISHSITMVASSVRPKRVPKCGMASSCGMGGGVGGANLAIWDPIPPSSFSDNGGQKCGKDLLVLKTSPTHRKYTRPFKQ